MLNVDTQNRSVQCTGILSIVELIAASAAIAHGNVKHAIRAEQNMTAIMVARGLRDRENELGRSCVGNIGVSTDHVAHHTRVTVGVRIVDVKVTVSGILGVKREAEQTLLAAGRHKARDIQKRGHVQLPVFDNANAPRLFDNKQTRVGGRRR